MKKIFFVLLLAPLSILAQKTALQKQPVKKPMPSFLITGTVTGLAEGTDIKLLDGNDNSNLASGKVVKGKFILIGKVAEPSLAILQLGSGVSQYIFIENKKIAITGSMANLKNLKVTGSASHNDFIAFQNTFNPLFASLNATAAMLNATPRGAGYDSLMVIYDSSRAKIQQQITAFIKQKPKSYVSPFLLFVTAEMSEDFLEMEKHYNLLDTTIRHSAIGQNLFNYIQYYKVGAVGTPALDFVQPDTAGNKISLSSFRGKYVLVDFWASWCGPCRIENPNVVENFKTFKDKNFTVLGVSLDKPDGRANWLAAIYRDSLTWTHVSDLKFWNNEAAQLYHVSSIPFNILVDPNGKIVARNLRGEALRLKLCELLGCN